MASWLRSAGAFPRIPAMRPGCGEAFRKDQAATEVLAAVVVVFLFAFALFW